MGGGPTRGPQEHPAADRTAELLRGLEQLKTDEPLVPGATFLDEENRGLHDRLAGTHVLAAR